MWSKSIKNDVNKLMRNDCQKSQHRANLAPKSLPKGSQLEGVVVRVWGPRPFQDGGYLGPGVSRERPESLLKIDSKNDAKNIGSWDPRCFQNEAKIKLKWSQHRWTNRSSNRSRKKHENTKTCLILEPLVLQKCTNRKNETLVFTFSAFIENVGPRAPKIVKHGAKMVPTWSPKASKIDNKND